MMTVIFTFHITYEMLLPLLGRHILVTFVLFVARYSVSLPVVSTEFHLQNEGTVTVMVMVVAGPTLVNDIAIMWRRLCSVKVIW